MIASGPIASDAAGDLGTCVAAALAELPSEGPELAGRGMEAAAVVARPRLDRPAEILGVGPRERRPAGPDRLERVGVAVADPRRMLSP